MNSINEGPEDALIPSNGKALTWQVENKNWWKQSRYGFAIVHYLERVRLHADITFQHGDDEYRFDFCNNNERTFYKVFDSVDVDEMTRYALLTHKPYVPQITFLIDGDRMKCGKCIHCERDWHLEPCSQAVEVGIRLGAYILMDGNMRAFNEDTQRYYGLDSLETDYDEEDEEESDEEEEDDDEEVC